jgi:hypothetical protein
MNDLIVVEKLAEWQRLKALVLDSVSSPITRRLYNMALDEFIEWYRQEPPSGFTKADHQSAASILSSPRPPARPRSSSASRPFASWPSKQLTTGYSHLDWRPA